MRRIAVVNFMTLDGVIQSVLSVDEDREGADRENSHVLDADVPAEVRKLKDTPGGDIVVSGSGALLPALAAADLIDRYTLLVFPLVLGEGKKMFADRFPPASLSLQDSEVSPKGVVILTYARVAR